jgi:hypothetical protein
MRERNLFKRMRMGVGVASILFSSTLLAVTKDNSQLEEMVITGTHIKGSHTEKSTPIVVLDRKDIELSGATTLNELFRDSVLNAAGMMDEQFTQGFAPASAGVVNIILRKQYDGVSLSTQYGASSHSDGEEARVSLTAGKTGDRYHLNFSLDLFDRNEVMAKDRDLSRSANGPIDDRSIAGNPGTIIGPTGPQPDARCPAQSLSGPFCSFDFATYNTLIPEAERTGASIIFDYDLTNNLKLFARGLFSHFDSERSLAPAASFFSVDAANPNNPLPGENIGVIYRLLELGPRVDSFKTDSYNVLHCRV